MNRREFLTATTGSLAGLSGCLGNNNKNTNQKLTPVPTHPGFAAQKLQTAVKHDGILASVLNYKTIPYYANATNYDYQNTTARPDKRQTPSVAGSTFLLVNVYFKHIGNGKLYFPWPKNIQLTTGNTDAEAVTANNPIAVHPTKYTPYKQTLNTHNNPHRKGAYSGVTLNAWRIFQVPQQFDPARTICSIKWNPTHSNPTTAHWRLSSTSSTSTTSSTTNTTS